MMWSYGAVLGVLASVPASPAADDDVALVEKVRAGDRDAFEALYRRHVAGVYARLSRLVGPVPEREDLTQEVFLGFHRALPRFRGDASPRTLLHRITVNAAIDHMRRRKRRPVEEIDVAALEELVDDEVGPDERARRAERLAGFTVRRNQANIPNDDLYFSDSGITRTTVEPALTSTGPNGSVLVINSPTPIAHDGVGSEPAGCRWPSNLGASTPGVITIDRREAETPAGALCP